MSRAGDQRFFSDRIFIKPVLFAAFFWLLLSINYVAKVIRETVLVSEFQAASYPRFYLTICLLTIPIGVVFSFLARVGPYVVIASYALSSLAFLLFWRLLETPGSAVYLAFYLWAAVYNVWSVCAFWSLADDVFQKEEARRYYGWIGAGGIAGAACGGFLAPRIPIGPTRNLLLVVVAGLLLCGVLTLFLALRYASPKAATVAITNGQHSKLNLIKPLLGDRYVIAIGALVILQTASLTNVELQVKGSLRLLSLSGDELKQFWGLYYGVLNVLALGIQTLLVSKMIRWWGLRRTLLVLPLAGLFLYPLLYFPLGSYLVPGVRLPVGAIIVACVGVPLGALAYSIQQVSKEMLYIPTNRTIKYGAKAFIDTFGFRLGNATTSIAAISIGWGTPDATFAGIQATDGLRIIFFVLCFLWLLVSVYSGMLYRRRVSEDCGK